MARLHQGLLTLGLLWLISVFGLTDAHSRLRQKFRGDKQQLAQVPEGMEGARDLSYVPMYAAPQATRAPYYTDLSHIGMERDMNLRKCVEWCGKHFYSPQLEGCEERCECRHLNYNATTEEKANKLRASALKPQAGCGEEFIKDGGEDTAAAEVATADSVENTLPLAPGGGMLENTDDAYSGGPLTVADELGLKPLSEVGQELALARAAGRDFPLN